MSSIELLGKATARVRTMPLKTGKPSLKWYKSSLSCQWGPWDGPQVDERAPQCQDCSWSVWSVLSCRTRAAESSSTNCRSEQRNLAPCLKSYILTILCDDDICVGAAVFMDVINGFLDTVHHFNAHFQVTILCSE